MDTPSFEAALAEATGGAAGELKLSGARADWPLAIGRADRICGPGWVLVGDAAHVVHPLAGQGLNLGLADVAVLADVIAAREPWRALGDALCPPARLPGARDGHPHRRSVAAVRRAGAVDARAAQPGPGRRAAPVPAQTRTHGTCARCLKPTPP
jgi:hypothetical protein